MQSCNWIWSSIHCINGSRSMRGAFHKACQSGKQSIQTQFKLWVIEVHISLIIIPSSVHDEVAGETQEQFASLHTGLGGAGGLSNGCMLVGQIICSKSPPAIISTLSKSSINSSNKGRHIKVQLQYLNYPSVTFWKIASHSFLITSDYPIVSLWRRNFVMLNTTWYTVFSDKAFAPNICENSLHQTI